MTRSQEQNQKAIFSHALLSLVAGHSFNNLLLDGIKKAAPQK